MSAVTAGYIVRATVADPKRPERTRVKDVSRLFHVHEAAAAFARLYAQAHPGTDPHIASVTIDDGLDDGGIV